MAVEKTTAGANSNKLSEEDSKLLQELSQPMTEEEYEILNDFLYPSMLDKLVENSKEKN